MRACLLVLAACGFHNGSAAAPDSGSRGSDSGSGSDAPGAQGWLPGYHYRKPITVTAAAALASFPVSVLEAADAALAMHALDGSDLVFTAGDGTTVLPSELVAFVRSSGALEAWTSMSLVAGTTDAYLYYGATAPPPVGDVWADYAGVWHMAGSASEHDSSPSQADLTVLTTTPTSTVGVVGAARLYSGGDALGTGSARTETAKLQFGNGPFSYEMWLDADPAASSAYTPCPLWQGGSSPTAAGYDLQLGSGWQAELVDNSGGTGGTGNLAYAPIGSQVSFIGTWAHVVAVVDRSTPALLFYANGSAVGSGSDLTGLGSLTNANDFEVGRMGTFTIYGGAIDEVRVIGTALSAEWIAAEYRNTSAGTRDSFIAIGQEQVVP